MKRIFTLALAMISLVSGISFAGTPERSTDTFNGAPYKPGLVIVKVKPEFKQFCTASGINNEQFLKVLSSVGANSVKKKFPFSKGPEFSKNKAKAVDITTIYEVRYSNGLPIGKVITQLLGSGILAYAEPQYIHSVNFTPNDPQQASQYQVGRINAYAAWDVWQGDTNTVIGIVDSGTDWDHPDLAANVKLNYADPIDGLDNDNDGFVDNFRGWDVSENDNNPMCVSQDHGSHVSGCAAAVTNNGVGVASPGFNCKFIGVKSSFDNSGTSIDNGYDGIVYAADHGCQIINCSWGRAGGSSSFENDVINYAYFNNDAVVCVAAGNNSVEQDYWPASYQNLICVASTTSTDRRSSFSNYGYHVDVSAPGTGILSTVFNNQYATYDGTSMASPIAAGVTAMIRSRWPNYTAEQAMRQLINTCDTIYSLSGNVTLRGKLGSGRVNLFRAVSDSVSPGIKLDTATYYDGADEIFLPGDTVSMVTLLRNVLAPSSANLSCTLTTTSPYAIILQNTYPAGVINANDTASNFAAPFRFRLLPTTPINTEVIFRVRMNDGAWRQDYYTKVLVNSDYINVAINDVASSLTSRGLLGYNANGQLQGVGFSYQGSPTILYEMGLMIGAAGTQVSDVVRGTGATNDEDFARVSRIVPQQPGTLADFDATASYNDNGSTSTTPLNLLIREIDHVWSAAPDNKYIMVRYQIKNNGTSTLNNLYAGIFSDWDIPAYANNKASVDASRKLGYCWSTDNGGLWAGVKVLTRSGTFKHYAMDNITGGGGASVDPSDGYDGNEKYVSLSTDRADAGSGSATGNDVLQVVSEGGFTLNAGDSVEVAFAIIAGDNLASIQASADAAQNKYDALPLSVSDNALSIQTSFEKIYPNPASTQITLDITIAKNAPVEIAVFDLTGKKVQTLISESLAQGRYNLLSDISSLTAGHYIVRMQAGDITKSLPLNIIR